MHRLEILRPEIGFVDKVEDFLPKTDKISLALNKAIEVHEGVNRKSGEPYVSHCVAVASILESWGLIQEIHEDLFCAALLHDAAEDTDYNLINIKDSFGSKVAELVDGVSKFRSEEKTDKADIDGETLKKVVMKAFLDAKVLLLKLDDRLHNMRTLWAMDEKKQVLKALETLNVYVPLAESLGMWVVKTELEDLAFSYINPRKHEAIKREIDGDKRFEHNFLNRLVEHTEGLMEQSNLQGELGIRAGGYWKSCKKREKAGMKAQSGLESFSDINDVLSLRVKFENIDDCYKFLVVLRQSYGELIDETRSDDFISIAPRDNGYKALQETIGFNEGAVEIAIMTKEMENFNNWGVVSLLRQKERDLSDYRLILLFTPAGDVRFLPIGSNGVDFAAGINRSLLADMIGVKVDGEDWDLSKPLPNGVTVEIVTGENGEVVEANRLLERKLLPKTKRIVEDLIRQREHDRLVEEGDKKMETVLMGRGLFCLEDIMKVKPGWNRKIMKVLFEFGCEDLRDLHYKFNSGALDAERLNTFLDKVGINKNGLGLVGVSLSGLNKQGVLAGVSKTISSIGGDMLNFKLIWGEEGKYRLRLVVDGVLNKEEELLDLLNSEGWSEVIEVV